MKDLLLLVADADMEAFFSGILQRPKAIQIRPITYEIQRHPLRDSGIIQSGAELARMRKGNFHKVILLWDHHGSGCEKRYSADDSAKAMQDKLDSYTWKTHSHTVSIDPELEIWLWHTESSIRKCWNLSEQQMELWIAEIAASLNRSIENAKKEVPKELFEFLIKEKVRRTISPRNFAQIGNSASMPALLKCGSFRAIIETLRRWFPPVK